MTTTTRLYDADWQAAYLGSDVVWTVKFLHLIGAKHLTVPATEWNTVTAMRSKGYSPVRAAVVWMSRTVPYLESK